MQADWAMWKNAARLWSAATQAEWWATCYPFGGCFLSELRAMSHPQRVQRRPEGAAAASPSAGTVQETKASQVSRRDRV